MACPNCVSKPAGRLQKHGTYVRSFKRLSGSTTKFKVARLRCAKCKVTHACLFEYLTPYSRYCTESLEQLAEPYLSEKTSYEQVGWAGCSEEGEGHRNLAFGVVKRLCEMREWITRFVEGQRNKAEKWLWQREEPDPGGDSPNADKAKSADKRAALNQVSEALVKLKKIIGGQHENLIGMLHQVSMGLRSPFSLLTSTKVKRVRGPHNSGYGLF